MRMRAALLVLCLAVVPELALAQDDTGEASPPSFNFQPPGARALGMGNAFLGLADDATAAEVNPAGLVQLSRMEVSAHFRSSESVQYFTSLFAEGEALSETSSTDELSFASFVRPFDRWAVSAYFAQNASVDFDAEDSRGGDTIRTVRDLTLESVGVSVAYRASDHFSAGLTLRMSQFDISSRQTTTFSTGRDKDLVLLENSGEDDLTFILGVLINPGGKVSLGVVYEEGGEYDVDQYAGPEKDEETGKTRISIDVPDVFGIGLAWRPTNSLVVQLDVKDISYSNLNPLYLGLLDRFDNVEALGLSETEINVGFEYTLQVDWGAVLLRAGGISDPDHDAFKNNGLQGDDFRVVDTEEFLLTAGIGVAGSSWQFDVGASFGDKAEDFIASFIYRF